MSTPNWIQGWTLDLASATTGTVGIAPTAGGLLTGNVKAGSNAANTVTCTDSVNGTYTVLGASSGDNSNHSGVFYAFNVSGSTATATIGSVVTGHSLRALIDSFSSVATAAPLTDSNTTATAAGASTAPSMNTNGTAAVVNDLVIGWFNPTAAAETITAGTGYTLVNVVPAAGASRLSTEWALVASSGQQTAAEHWTSTSNYASFIGVFAQVVGGAAAVFPPRLAAMGVGR